MEYPKRDMKRQTALITGASGGIGSAFVEVLADDGYDCFITGRNKKLLESIAEFEQKRTSRNVFPIGADLTRRVDREKLYAIVEKSNRSVDVLINCAGSGTFGPFIETDIEKEIESININISALTHVTKHFVQVMHKQGHGRILNIASTGALRPGPVMSVYCAAKSYVLSFSQALAVELSSSGITVTVLCPGPTETAFMKKSGRDRPGKKDLRKKSSPKHVAEYGYRAMISGRTCVIHGFKNKMVHGVLKFLPVNLITRLVYTRRRNAD